MSKTSLTAVNSLRKRLQDAAEKYICDITNNFYGEYDEYEAREYAAELHDRLDGYIKAYHELGLITKIEMHHLFHGINTCDPDNAWHLKRMRGVPLTIPSIGYSDTMKYISHALEYLLRKQIARACTPKDLTSAAIAAEEKYFYTGADLGIFTQEQIKYLQRSNSVRQCMLDECDERW